MSSIPPKVFLSTRRRNEDRESGDSTFLSAFVYVWKVQFVISLEFIFIFAGADARMEGSRENAAYMEKEEWRCYHSPLSSLRTGTQARGQDLCITT